MNRLWDLVVLVVIAAVGLFVAYVTFGILESQASTDIQKYKVGGAIAGFLVTTSMLLSAYRSFRKSSGELEKLQDRIQELQQKLIRGAPRPKTFEIEVDERLRVVLARPENWEPKGGTIFDFEQRQEHLAKGDVFPARFQVLYGPISPETEAADQYYARALKMYESPAIGNWTSEFVSIGGDNNRIKSLKVIGQLFAKITLSENTLTRKEDTALEILTKEQFLAATATSPQVPEPAVGATAAQDKSKDPTSDSIASSPTHRVAFRRLWQMQVVCYHEDLRKMFIFNFWDDEGDFTKSSAQFNQILDSVRFLT